jgi:hypothetical protein
MRHLTKFILISVALVSAIALALLSVHIERIGPERVEYGNLCGPGGSDPCYEPALKGGFPAAFLFDAPGVSVERQLAFVEDKLSAGALVLDIAVYFTIVLLGMFLMLRRAERTTDRKKAGTIDSRSVHEERIPITAVASFLLSWLALLPSFPSCFWPALFSWIFSRLGFYS